METETQPLKRLVLNENKRNILVAIAQSPRKPKSFTHGDFARQMHPDVISGWLTELEAHGLVYCAESAYHITTKGRQKLDQGKQDEYRTAGLRNVMAQGTYKTGDGDPGGNYQRPGSSTKHLLSKGTPC